MLDARVIGSYISHLRKEADLTQVELADQLNVSHQAVSKWERGESIPDIGCLLELAKTFDKSVDQLLNGGRHKQVGNLESLVTNIVQNRPERAAELINSGETEVEGLIEVAPLVKASSLRKVTAPLNHQRFTFEHLIHLAPFLDSDSLDKLIQETKKTDVEYEDIVSLAPFLKSNSLLTLIENNEGSPSFRNIINLAPFLHGHAEQLIDQAEITHLKWQDIAAIAPFVKSELLIRLIDETVEEPANIQEIINLAPFLGGHVDPFLEKVKAETIHWDEVASLAPFLQSETLARLINEKVEGVVDTQEIIEIIPFLNGHINKIIEKVNLESLSWDDLGSLAPFLQGGQLDELIQTADPKGLNPDAVSSIAPFLKKETLNQMITQWSEQHKK